MPSAVLSPSRMCAVFFALSVVAWTAAALTFGPRVALLTAAALLVYPGYGLMFHELSSETTFAAGFALWGLLVVRAAVQPSVRRFALVGLGIALLALIRPGNAVLLAFVAFPLLVVGTWRNRVRWAAAIALAAVVPLAAWTVHNGVRFDTWALARGGNAIIPFYRAFITDHIVGPENGEASRRLAAAMQQHLLTRDPYRSYDVTLDELFRRGSFRVHEDLYILSDQVFGWDSDYRVLRDAGVEGVRAHPGTYASGVLGTVWNELAKAQFRRRDRAPHRQPRRIGKPRAAFPCRPRGSPSRPDRWSGSRVRIRASARCGPPPRTGTSSSTTPHSASASARSRRRGTRLFASLPTRAGNAQLALRLDQLSRWFPRPWMWIVVGLAGIAFRRPRGAATLVALALAASASSS